MNRIRAGIALIGAVLIITAAVHHTHPAAAGVGLAGMLVIAGAVLGGPE